MRLIDADALLEAMKATDRYFMVKFDIEKAPTVDQWYYPSKGEIPDKGKVLICLNELDEGEPRMEIATLEWTGKFYLGHNCNDYLADEIRAWMPLPEPPKEEA